MMNKTKTRKPAMMKYLLVAPLTLGLIMTSNLEILANQAKEMLQTNASNNETIGKYTAISEVEMQQPQNQDKKELKVENKVQVNIPATTSVAPPPPPPPAQGNAKSEKISQDEVVYQSVEKMPAFPGGDAELINYLTHNIKYPAEAAKKGIQGRVICQFVVNRDGSVANVEAVRSVDPELDAEAIRVITAMPKWTPGTQKGETVRVKYTLPINFRLGDEKPNPAKATALEPGKQPVYLVNGEKLPEGMNINSIKPETIEKIDVTKPENEIEKAKLISKYGPNGANGIVNITLKK
jgi:TonB family protein